MRPGGREEWECMVRGLEYRSLLGLGLRLRLGMENGNGNGIAIGDRKLAWVRVYKSMNVSCVEARSRLLRPRSGKWSSSTIKMSPKSSQMPFLRYTELT